MAPRVRLPRQIAYNTWGEATYAVDTRSQQVIVLEQTARTIWFSLEQWIEIDSIVAAMHARFPDVPSATIGMDVTRFLAELDATGFLETEGLRNLVSGMDAKLPESMGALRSWALKNRIPLFADVELTLDCNLECRHCYLRPLSNKTLSADVVCQAIDDVAALGGLMIALTGGEPTLHPALVEVAGHATSHHMWVRLLTNGVSVTEELVRALGSMGTLSVEISLYGSTACVHDWITRRPGSWLRTLDAAALFCNAGMPVTLKVTLFRGNYHQVDDMVQLGEERAAIVRFLTYVSPTLAGGYQPLSLRLSDAMLADAVRRGLVRPTPVACSAGRGKVWICADGSVAPCEYARERLGSLDGGGLVAAWKSMNQAVLKPIWRGVRPPACRPCPHVTYCPRCPGLARLEQGRYDARQTEACRLAGLWADHLGTFGNRTSAREGG